MPTEAAARKADERARKHALGLKRHEWWLKPAPAGQRWMPKLCYEKPLLAAFKEFASRTQKARKR